MNLYQLHNQPDKLAGAGVADEKIPKLVWDKYRANTRSVGSGERCSRT